MNPLLDPRTFRVARNSYWRVRDDVDELTHDGAPTLAVTTGKIRPNGKWYGASQAYDVVTEPELVRPGDEVHVLFGGTFLVRRIHGVPACREVRWPDAGDPNPYSGDDPRERALANWLLAATTPIEGELLPALRYRSSFGWPE